MWSQSSFYSCSRPKTKIPLLSSVRAIRRKVTPGTLPGDPSSPVPRDPRVFSKKDLFLESLQKCLFHCKLSKNLPRSFCLTPCKNNFPRGINVYVSYKSKLVEETNLLVSYTLPVSNFIFTIDGECLKWVHKWENEQHVETLHLIIEVKRFLLCPYPSNLHNGFPECRPFVMVWT